jgi:hypothetical protein
LSLVIVLGGISTMMKSYRKNYARSIFSCGFNNANKKRNEKCAGM